MKKLLFTYCLATVFSLNAMSYDMIFSNHTQYTDEQIATLFDQRMGHTLQEFNRSQNANLIAAIRDLDYTDRRLNKLFIDAIFRHITTPNALRAYIEASPSLVHALAVRQYLRTRTRHDNIKYVAGVQVHLNITDIIDAGVLPPIVDGVLDLYNYNLVSLVGIDEIPNSGTVTRLDISGNKLTELAPDVFDYMTGLMSIVADDNKITELDGDTFADLPQLQSISVINNPITNARLTGAVIPRGCTLRYTVYNAPQHFDEQFEEMIEEGHPVHQAAEYNGMEFPGLNDDLSRNIGNLPADSDDETESAPRSDDDEEQDAYDRAEYLDEHRELD